jgi:hypothetical protein
MDGGQAVLKHHVLLLKVFLCIGGRRAGDYERALTAQLAVWIQLKKINHPAWQMFLANCSVFNEECGELSFSALARQVARGGSRSNFDQAHRQYELLKTGMQVAEDFRFELNGPQVSQRRGKTIEAEGKDVQQTAFFFKRTINALRTRSYRHYDKRLGKPNLKGDTRPTIRLRYMVKSMFKECEDLLDKPIHQVQRNFNKLYITEANKDIWPGAEKAARGSGDDSDLSDDVDDDGDWSEVEGEAQTEINHPEEVEELKKWKKTQPRKRRKVQHPDKKQEDFPGLQYVNRVVTIKPSAMWLDKGFLRQMYGKDYNQAKIHMRIVRHLMKKCKRPLMGQLVHPELYADEEDDDVEVYELSFSVAMVVDTMVETQAEYVDTPSLDF